MANRNTICSDVGTDQAVLFCHVKNEAPFIVEWIAYHKAIGFDEIVICSNPSTDGTEEILEALSNAGLIKHIRTTVKTGQSVHEAAVAEYNGSVGYTPGQWYMWLDADEFLNVHVGSGSVSDLLVALRGYSGILVNWRIFGTSGNVIFPGKFIDAAFSKAAAKGRVANLEVKTFFKFGVEFQGFSPKYSHRPLMDKGARLKPENFLTGCGKPALSTSARNVEWLTGVGEKSFHLVEEAEFGWKLAQVNHYAVRTPEMFMLKRARGRASVPLGKTQQNERYRDNFFKRYDKNDEEDTSVLRWKEKTALVIAEMHRLPGMQEAVQNAELKTRAELVALGVGKLPDPDSPSHIESERKFRHPNVEARALARAKRIEGKDYVLYEYPDYGTYRQVQIAGNKAKLTWQSVPESHIVLLARWLNKNLGRVSFGLCHGTRRGAEQEWFHLHLSGHPTVIGTEISGTASQFPNTCQWDFHEENPAWEGSADFVYSNSWNHAYSPRSAFQAWFAALRPGGVLLLDHSRGHGPRGANELNPFGITVEALQALLADTLGSSARMLPALDFREEASEYRSRVLLLRKNA